MTGSTKTQERRDREFSRSPEGVTNGSTLGDKGSEEDYEGVAEALDGTVSVREILSYIDSDRYMTFEKVLEYLPLSERNIRKRLPEIPHYRVGKRLLFKKSELDLWMENHRENGEQLDLRRTAEEALEKIRGDYPDN